jgi:hypothetical protein
VIVAWQDKPQDKPLVSLAKILQNSLQKVEERARPRVPGLKIGIAICDVVHTR